MSLRNPEETIVYEPDKDDSSPPKSPIEGDDSGLKKEPQDDAQAEENIARFERIRITRNSRRALLTTMTDRVRRATIEEEILEGNFDRAHLLKKLSPKIAEALVNSGVHSIMLFHVASLSPECARELAKFKGIMLLDGLKDLSPETAQVLSEGEFRQLSLNGLELVREDAMRHLSRGRFNALSLCGLSEISENTASVIGNFRGVLSLDSIHNVDAKTLRQLLKTNTVAIAELKGTGPKTAEALKDYSDDERMSFDDFQKLSPKTAKKMGAFLALKEYKTRERKMPIEQLLGLFPESEYPTVVKALREFADSGKEKISVLNFLKTFPSLQKQYDTFDVLKEHSNIISLQGLRDVDDQVIAILNAHRKRLFVSDGVDKLIELDSMSTIRIVKSIPDHDRNLGIWKQVLTGDVRLISLFSYIDARIAEDILKVAKDFIALNGVKKIDVETAKKLATFEGSEIFLEKVDEISYAAAEELSAFQGTVRLANMVNLHQNIDIWHEIMNGHFENVHKMTGIIPDVAKKLVDAKLASLDLSGLLDLGHGCADILTEFDGEEINMGGLDKITPELGVYLADSKASALLLDGVKILDPRTAEFLFKFEGEMISLSGLAFVDTSLNNKIKEAVCKNIVVSSEAKTKGFKLFLESRKKQK